MNAGFKRLLVLLGLLSAPFGLWLLANNPPTVGGFYPPCIFNASTGLHCPGCGGTRALYLLLNGDITGALQQNALLLLALPLAGWYFVALTVFAVRGKWVAPKVDGSKLTVVVAVLVIGFGIARNVPMFALLAPKPLVAYTPDPKFDR